MSTKQAVVTMSPPSPGISYVHGNLGSESMHNFSALTGNGLLSGDGGDNRSREARPRGARKVDLAGSLATRGGLSIPRDAASLPRVRRRPVVDCPALCPSLLLGGLA